LLDTQRLWVVEKLLLLWLELLLPLLLWLMLPTLTMASPQAKRT